jgi:protein required for attachment to host cells
MPDAYLASGYAKKRTRMTKTPTGLYNHAWFALADAKSCRLLCCSLTRRGKHHIDEYDAMKNTLPEQEHARPMTNAGTTHNVEDNERCFAGEIVVWLKKKTEQYAIDRLVIFAPPRMLGVLRMVPLGSLKGHVEELKGDLMRLNAGQLADHPMIRELVTPHPSVEGAAFEPKATSTVGRAAGGHRTSPTGGA